MPLKALHENLGGFPVVMGDAWDGSKNSWEGLVKQLRDLGYSTDYIIDFSVDTDLKNSSRHLINVSKKSKLQPSIKKLLQFRRLIRQTLVSTLNIY